MDDFTKDIFGNSEKKDEVNAEAPISADAQAPIIKNEADLGPAPVPAPADAPQEKAEFSPQIETPKPKIISPLSPSTDSARAASPAPNQPQAAPPVNTPPVQNNGAYGFNAYEEPVQKIFFQPPIQQTVPHESPKVNNRGENNFDIPPAFNQKTGENGVNAYNGESVQPRKKKSKAGFTVLIIAIVIVAISIGGLAYAIGTYKVDGTASSSQSEQATEPDVNKEAEGDDVTVNSSEKTQKKDSKGNLTVTGVVENSKASCVGITVYSQQDDFSYFYNFGNDNNQANENGEVKAGEGSGVIFSERGDTTYIITCAHVISDGTKFTVTLDNDKEYEAKMVGSDAQTDIGVLSIQAKGLSVAEFGDSKDIEVGEDCVAIGCPGGLEFKNSVTKGIVSGLDVPVASSIGYNNQCIQVDAAINPGNSGGALFNMQGQVIGINSSKIASTEYEGMGFAVPSNTAVQTANALIKDGVVKGRAKIGIQYATFSMLQSGGSQLLAALEKEGFKDAEGTMIIQEIDSESDLKGKVEKNDMIVAVNGQTLTSTDVMTSTLSKSKPGDTVELTIARVKGNDISTFKVKCKLIESKQ